MDYDSDSANDQGQDMLESSDDEEREIESVCSYEYESDFYEDEDLSAEAKNNSRQGEIDSGFPEKMERRKCDTDDSLDLVRQTNVAWDLRRAEKLMNKMVRETASLLCLPPGMAHVVLRHFKWDVDMLNDKYFGGEESVWRNCGVNGGGSNGTDRQRDGDRRIGLCEICFENGLGPEQMFSMKCGHGYCVSCWGTYLETAINTEGPRCLHTTCPKPGCHEVITEDVVAELAPSAHEKFKRYQLRSFIENSKSMRWCPGPSCEKIVVAGSEGFEGEITCSCGTAFCLVCGEASHTPLSCRTLSVWNRKCMDESENANWILVNTKECPNCHVRIEKNQGCNHMTCRRCNYEFCWLCMGDWTKHRSCNKFDLEQVKKGQSELSRAEAELKRYLHCYDRFHSHTEGQTFAEDQLRAFLKANEEKASSTVEKPEDRVFQNALRQLIECRRVLRYSYAVVYFMKTGSSTKELFEDQQKLLESFTERLSELTESKQRQEKELMNMTGAVSHFVNNVLSGGPY
mmetsp:Transcript_28157/g.52418  ORF Transcript_28157/g.52418 Transcript_28157/m.52418 type:complete len:515 (-) Transcript_28157:196-1740(-)